MGFSGRKRFSAVSQGWGEKVVTEFPAELFGEKEEQGKDEGGESIMKACKFCGTQVPDQERQCPSCGSSTFLRICENCGTEFESSFCPNCGVKAGQARKICPECGNAYFTNACPNCGYVPSRRPAVQEVVHHHIYERPQVPPAPPPPPSPPSRGRRGRKGKRWGCLTWILILIGLGLLFGNDGSSKKSTSGSVRVTQTSSTNAAESSGSGK